MTFDRYPQRDPRTIARDVPGILNIVFPQLTTATAIFLNRRATDFSGGEPVNDQLVEQSSISHAMLFEIASARCEKMIGGELNPNWEECVKIATERQSRHFDAKIPDKIDAVDFEIAEKTSQNLYAMLQYIQSDEIGSDIVIESFVPGFHWIASGSGDFAVNKNLIEVKCTASGFRMADYRQIMMYWLLSYSAAVERTHANEWETCTLLNPRRNRIVRLSFNELIEIGSIGRSKSDVLALFSELISTYRLSPVI